MSKHILGCLMGVGVVFEPLLRVRRTEDHAVSVPGALRVGNTATCVACGLLGGHRGREPEGRATRRS